MLKITTRPITPHSDWYQATTITPIGQTYISHHSTRHSAFMDVLRQLAVSDHIRF